MIITTEQKFYGVLERSIPSADSLMTRWEAGETFRAIVTHIRNGLGGRQQFIDQISSHLMDIKPHTS